MIILFKVFLHLYNNTKSEKYLVPFLGYGSIPVRMTSCTIKKSAPIATWW